MSTPVPSTPEARAALEAARKELAENGPSDMLWQQAYPKGEEAYRVRDDAFRDAMKRKNH